MDVNPAFQLLAQANDHVFVHDQWSDTFFGLDEGKRFVILLIGIGCATGILITAIAGICSLIQSTHQRRLEAEMKREMLDRGMSAEEIALVVESAPPDGFLERWAKSQTSGQK